VLVGAKAEVLDSLAGVLGATEDQGVGASRGTESQLIKGNSLSTSSSDAGAGGSSESQSGDRDLGESQEAVVIGNGTNDYDSPLLVLLNVGDNARQRDGWSVDLRHEQTAENNLVEGRIGSACKY
jgi:hypothetical protein